MNGNEYKKELSRLRPRLVGIARKYLADADEAEDAVQDAMLRIWQMKEQLRLPIDSFAFILVRNISVNMLRHKRDTVPIENLAVEMPDNEERRQRMEELHGRDLRKGSRACMEHHLLCIGGPLSGRMGIS